MSHGDSCPKWIKELQGSGKLYIRPFDEEERLRAIERGIANNNIIIYQKKGTNETTR